MHPGRGPHPRTACYSASRDRAVASRPRRLFEPFIASVGIEIRPPWAYSSVGLERTPDKREVGGSNPPRPTTIRRPLLRGAVAQLVERQLCKLDVVGSIPISSTSCSGTSGPGRRPARRGEQPSTLTTEYEG